MATRKKISETKTIPFIRMEDYLCDSKRWVLEGLPRSEVLNRIASLNSDLTEKDIQEIYAKTVIFFEKNIVDLVDLPEIVDLHVAEYEKIYNHFVTKDNLYGRRKCMSQKEKLLGFFKDESVVEFNQINNTLIEREEEYDISKLSTEEQKQFIELQNKIEVKRDVSN